ncbi:MAG: tetratricopeptide repeat protein [Bacteroidales bacterium]|jgi:tetratricopeptide (TPR) repeat protein|nr:tetratricopeptide repeat protein [Bacteroidales bacterium]
MNINDPAGRIEASHTVVDRIMEQSGYCNRIMDACIDLKKKIEQTQDEETLLKLNNELQLKMNRMLKLKKYALDIHETFRTIPRSSERLQQAGEYFYGGKFEEMDEALDDGEICAEIERLNEDLHSKDEEQKKKTRVRLECRSYELIIKALYRYTFIENPEWHKDVYDLLEAAHDASCNVHALFEFAAYLMITTEKDWAIELLDDAYVMARELNGENCSLYEAKCLWAKGVIARKKQNFPEAIEHVGKALKIYTLLTEKNPVEYRPRMADMLTVMGDYHTYSENYATAVVVFEEAVKIRRELALHGSGEDAMNLARTLDKLAVVHTCLGEYGDAVSRFEDALRIENDQLEYNLYMVLAAKANILYNLSAALFGAKKYDGAIRRIKEELEVRKKVRETDPFGQLPLMARAHDVLADAYLELGQPEDAIREREEIVKLYKTLAEHSPETWLCSLGEALNQCSNLYFEMKSYDKYFLLTKKALEVFRKLAAGDPEKYLISVGCLLGNVCHYYEMISPDRKKKIETAREICRILSSVERDELTEIVYAKAKEILGTYPWRTI